MSFERRVGLDVLMMLWGMGAWLGVVALYVQLPYLMQSLPEAEALPSSVLLVVLLANVGVLLYAGLRRLFPNFPDGQYILILLTIAHFALAIIPFVYGISTTIGSSEVSLAFLILTFLVALNGCVSPVLFYPYLTNFREVYQATYFVGEGLAWLVPSYLALVQGIGGDKECVHSEDGLSLITQYPTPRFEAALYIVVVMLVTIGSMVGFALIERLKRFKSERVEVVDKEEDAAPLLSARWLGVMLLTGCINAIGNGVLPLVLSYSNEPYGSMTFQLSATLGALASPVACSVGVWRRPVSARTLTALLAAASLPFAYILTTALTSPAPPLQGTVIGTILVISAWVATIAVLSYARMWIFGWARRGGARGMRACGAAAQAGNASGLLLLFVLITYTGIFVPADVCSTSTATLSF